VNAQAAPRYVGHVPMALIFSLFACNPEPALEPGCPVFDWSVHLHSSIYDEVFQAIPLPDGDMILSGNHGGAVQIGTDGTRLLPAYGPRDGFLARLSPAGAVRWSHVIGGIHADQAGTVRLSNGGLWMALAASGYEILLDWEPLAGTGDGAEDPTGTSAFYIGFDLDGGLLGYQRLSPVTGQSARAVATDEAGNRYVLGAFVGTMTIGPWTHSADSERAFVASYDAAGNARWLTTVGGEGYDRPTGMVVFDDHLLAVVNHLSTDLTLQHDGTDPVPWPRTTMGLLTLDLATGVPVGAPDSTSLAGTTSRSLEPGPAGTAILTGSASAPGEWHDPSGELHSLAGPAGWTGPATFGHQAVLDEAGQVRAIPSWQNQDYVGSSATAGPIAVAGWLGGALGGADGTEVEWTDPRLGFRDAVAAVFDEHGGLRCGWKLGGEREQDAFDAAIDADGGVWVVGKFIEQLVVRDPDGTVVTALETEENESDGFVLRFRPPGE
jgi:hypothetical protein